MLILHGTIFNSVIFFPLFRLSSSQVIPLSLVALSFIELWLLESGNTNMGFFSPSVNIFWRVATPNLHRIVLMISRLHDFSVYSSLREFYSY